jgi:hypothetical protein
MPTNEENKVNTPSIEYRQMSEQWDLLHDLLGGTKTMRQAREKWLMMEPREQDIAYRNRLQRTYLYNAFRDTVEKLVSKPFSRPVTTQGNLPERLESMLQNMDMTGRDITQFSRDLFTAGVTYGLSHVLVDFPQFAPTATLADERASGVRPLFVHVPPTNLIGWRTETQENGEQMLVQARIYEKKIEAYGEYGDRECEYIRVYTPDSWQLWKRDKADTDDYLLMDEGTHTFGGIPLATFYVSRTGMATATPPLNDLAWLNLAHWQSMSDQRNVLRFARVGLLFAAGFSDEEMEEGLTIGPNQLIRSTNEAAKVSYVEHKGEAIKSGQEDLDKLEDRMKVLGLQPLVSRTGNQTATGRALDESRTHTAIQAWIRSLENTLRQAFEMAAKWVKLEIEDDFSIDINNDFGLSVRAAEDIESLIEMRKTGEVSRETFLREIKRRGLLSEAVDIETEMLTIEDEGPMLAGILAPIEEEEEEIEEEVAEDGTEE